jgi:5-methylcytosine-specific restriction endonuclease McrA
VNIDPDDFAMRKPCPYCGNEAGRLVERNGQDTVRCNACGRFVYNAPRTETGRAARTVSTVHAAVRPALRARILDRDGTCCVICRTTESRFHVGHIIPVEAGILYGLSDVEINDEENLAVMCEECNLGYQDRPIPLRTAIAIVRARISWRNRKELS